MSPTQKNYKKILSNKEMYSEFKHSKKLSKRLQRDSEFHDILYQADNRNYSEIEPGLREVKYLKDMETIFSDVSVNESVKLYDKVQCIDNNERLYLDKVYQSYKKKEEYLLKKRLACLKWTNKKLKLIPMTISRLPNPMKKVILGNYTFPLDSTIFTDYINDKTQEYSSFCNVSDLKRVKSAIYDSNISVFIAQYHDTIDSKQQNLFIGQQKNYYLEWLDSLGNLKAKETIEILNRMAQAELKDQENCSYYTSIVPKTHEEKIVLSSIDEKTLEWIKNRAYTSRFRKISHNESSVESGIEVVYSMAYLNLLGYYELDKDIILHNLLGSTIQNSLYTKQWFNSSQCCDDFRNSKVEDKLWLEDINNRFLLKDRYGEFSEYKILVFDEKYFEKGFLFRKTYLVHIDEKSS